mmetsp:Transcript_38661/g.60294  ORF Transcript_38661/g.60294 Transcript_38661/m.60294 type:complete len:230 (-) Transcript_38661:553-1242(-)
MLSPDRPRLTPPILWLLMASALLLSILRVSLPFEGLCSLASTRLPLRWLTVLLRLCLTPSGAPLKLPCPLSAASARASSAVLLSPGVFVLLLTPVLAFTDTLSLESGVPVVLLTGTDDPVLFPPVSEEVLELEPALILPTLLLPDASPEWISSSSGGCASGMLPVFPSPALTATSRGGGSISSQDPATGMPEVSWHCKHMSLKSRHESSSKFLNDSATQNMHVAIRVLV